MHDIARSFDIFHSSIQEIIAKTGGIRLQEKTRSALRLTPQEREEISFSLPSQSSTFQIVKQLNRSPSVLSREVSRNARRKLYRTNKADAAVH